MTRKNHYLNDWLTKCFRTVPALVLAGLLMGCSDVDVSKEVLRDDEAQQGEATRAHFIKLVDEHRTDYVARGAHAKAHACVRAYFDVLPDLRGEFRYGVFAEPGRRYKTWVRFSNGNFNMKTSQDYRNDVRGMALKLLEVNGQPLEQGDLGSVTQDFLMLTTPVFIVSNSADYNYFMANLDQGKKFFFPDWNPFNWRIRELLAVKRAVTPPPASVLEPTYYSAAPFKLGPHNIKFAMRACHKRNGVAPATAEPEGADFLREQLREQLAETAACFIFQVQLQRTGRGGMSLEDGLEEWSEDDAPFIPLAALTIPPQTFSTPAQTEFCENLSFSPWHALPEHRPLGQLNRLRRHAYPASSGYRHERNEAEIPDAMAYWEAGD